MGRQPIYRSRIPARGQRNLVRRTRRTARWQWLVAAVALGAFGYFLYWLASDNFAAQPPVANPAPTKTESVEKSPTAIKPVPPAVKPTPKEPRFTFYTLLPEKEVTIPEGEVRARKRAEILGQTKPNDYFIQVGSFHSPDDAELIKAKLSRLGVQARLEKTEIGKVLWYRVRIGPFKTLREVEAVRARLRGYRIDSIVQTVKR